MPTYQSDSQLNDDHVAITRLDRNLLRVRRIMVKPPATTLPVAATGEPVDIAKVMACMAIDDATSKAPPGTEPPTITQLAAALGLDHSTASRLLTDAEAEGLVLRGTDPSDRRRTIVELTDTGRAVVTESAVVRHWVLSQVLVDWDVADVDMLATLVERFTDSLARRLPDVMCAAQAQWGSGRFSKEHD